MIEEYVKDQEYDTHYSTLNNLRRQIAKKLPVESGMCLLDLATGYGFFAIEVAKAYAGVRITGVDISQSCIENAGKNVEREGFQKCITIVKMDATHMSFSDSQFDMAFNFAGLEDIHMTRGEAGVAKVFREIYRVLKTDSYFAFVVMPPEEMETEAQKIEVNLYSYICGATWLSAARYRDILEMAGFKLKGRKDYYTGKKLTPEQAMVEIRFACESVPEIYGIKTPSFEQVWRRFGSQIEKNGLGQHSKILLMTAYKAEPNQSL